MLFFYFILDSVAQYYVGDIFEWLWTGGYISFFCLSIVLQFITLSVSTDQHETNFYYVAAQQYGANLYSFRRICGCKHVNLILNSAFINFKICTDIFSIFYPIILGSINAVFATLMLRITKTPV